MKKLHIVLVHPKIAANTGNIIRLCANTGAVLHLLQPLGFDLDDKKLRRAGLDYHEYAHINVHRDWQAIKDHLGQIPLFALTTKFSGSFYAIDFTKRASASNELALVFGSETEGLPESIRADIGMDNWLRLPMLPDSRSLNLSNSVAICLYEVWRQWGFVGDVGKSVGYDKPTSR